MDIPRGRATAPDGVLLVDKPAGLTSHDVVARVRRMAATRKVGHAGTLDPMATGLLVIGIGRATRLLTYMVGADKTYEATIRLGISTTTDDAEGEIVSSPGARLTPDGDDLVRGHPDGGDPAGGHPLGDDLGGGHPDESDPVGDPGAGDRDGDHPVGDTGGGDLDGDHPAGGHPGGLGRERLAGALADLTGDILQAPSSVSAIKVDGVRAHARVRDGEAVELPARPVTVHELTIMAEPRPGVVPEGEPGAGTAVVDLDVRVRCSSGTYVRAIARDLGQALGTGGHLTALRRTAVGPFEVGEGTTLDGLARAVSDVQGDGVLATWPAGRPARRMFPARELTEDETRAVRYGQRIDASATFGSGSQGPESDDVRAEGSGSRGSESEGSGADPDLRGRGPRGQDARGRGPRGQDARGRGMPGPGDSTDVVGAYAPDGRLVALLRHEDGRMRPVLVLDPA